MNPLCASKWSRFRICSCYPLRVWSTWWTNMKWWFENMIKSHLEWWVLFVSSKIDVFRLILHLLFRTKSMFVQARHTWLYVSSELVRLRVWNIIFQHRKFILKEYKWCSRFSRKAKRTHQNYIFHSELKLYVDRIRIYVRFFWQIEKSNSRSPFSSKHESRKKEREKNY